MNLKITLTVDPDRGEQLVGLLAKALGRGELGVSDLRIEREATVANSTVALKPVRQSTIAKMIAARERPKRKAREGNYLGMRAVKSGKPNGVTLMLRALKFEASLDGIHEMWRVNGFNTNGVGASLSKLKHRGYVKRVGEGVWRLTPEGEELEQRLNQEVKSDGGQD
jgi:hypothetical protein